jgi:hypothetical protein
MQETWFRFLSLQASCEWPELLFCLYCLESLFYVRAMHEAIQCFSVFKLVNGLDFSSCVIDWKFVYSIQLQYHICYHVKFRMQIRTESCVLYIVSWGKFSLYLVSFVDLQFDNFVLLSDSAIFQSPSKQVFLIPDLDVIFWSNLMIQRYYCVGYIVKKCFRMHLILA